MYMNTSHNYMNWTAFSVSTAPKERVADSAKMSKNKKKKMKKKMKKQQALLEIQMQQIEEVATQVPLDSADSCDLLVDIEKTL